MTALTRRVPDTSLGPFRLGEFNDVFTAIVAMCSAHDYLCFRWAQQTRVYPLESAVLVWNRADWLDVLSALADVPRDRCNEVLSDLTFDRRSVDLHIHPFVQVDRANDVLAVAPPFPMHSNHEENILRVCSQRRREAFDAISLAKQSEMVTALRSTVRQYRILDNVPLPAPNPDIDLIVADETSSTVIFAELKWIRKPVRPLERPDRDADVLKGVEQLRSIRAFLRANSSHLQGHGRLARAVTAYDAVHYVLVARDHWLWVDPSDEIATVEFDRFARTLGESTSLRAAMEDLLRYDWLPIEGRDFRVAFSRATANGVSVESEIFHVP